MYHRINRKRRGLSGVIGGAFMIVVMVAALGVIVQTMDEQNRTFQTVLQSTDAKRDALNERIEINEVRIDENRFNLTVSNTGAVAANLKSIYVVNETANPKEQFTYEVDHLIDGREYLTNIGQSLPLTTSDDTEYTIKIVSDAGSIVTAKVSPLASMAYPLSLSIIPPTITPGENVTLLFTVTNNNTVAHLASPVGVKITPGIISGCTLGVECTIELEKSPSNNNTIISQGSTAVFQWVYNVDGPDNSVFSFNATLAGAKEGNYVMERGDMQLIDAAKTSFQSEIVVTSTLVQKPEIFAMFPSPFGDVSSQTDKAVWGVVVANPTEQPMEVTKIIATLISPRGQSNDKIIDVGGADGCAVTPVPSTETNYWSCPAVNMLMWKKTDPGFTVEPRSVKGFMVSVHPGSLASGSIDLESFSIDVTVFTSMGQFSKSGYSGSMRNQGGAMPNVYMSTIPDSTSTSNMIGNLTGLRAGSWVTFNATLADMDTTSSHWINSGSTLIINVPKSFDLVTDLQGTGFTITGPTEYSDGSWQIRGTLNSDLGKVNQKQAQTIQFRAHVSTDIPDQRVYIMYLLAYGESDGTSEAFPIGPIAEFPIQVIP